MSPSEKLLIDIPEGIQCEVIRATPEWGTHSGYVGSRRPLAVFTDMVLRNARQEASSRGSYGAVADLPDKWEFVPTTMLLVADDDTLVRMNNQAAASARRAEDAERLLAEALEWRKQAEGAQQPLKDRAADAERRFATADAARISAELDANRLRAIVARLREGLGEVRYQRMMGEPEPPSTDPTVTRFSHIEIDE